MPAPLPTVPPGSFEEALLARATDHLIERWRDRADTAALADAVDAALDALGGDLERSGWAQLVRNVVERLLLLDHALAAEIDDDAFPSDVRDSLRKDREVRGTGLLRALAVAGRVRGEDGGWLRDLDGLVADAWGPLPRWERHLLTPSGRRDLELDALPARFDLDPSVLEAVRVPAAAPGLKERFAAAFEALGDRWSGFAGGVSGALRLAPVAVLDAGSPRVGDRVTLDVPAGDTPGAIRPVVLRAAGETAHVVYPLEVDDWVALDAFPPGVSPATRALDVVLEAPEGVHRYAVLRVADEHAVDFGLGPEVRWLAVLEAAAAGQVPVDVVTLDVEGLPDPPVGR